jgi:hypothetical protein
MMVITPLLAELRMQARKVFPKATWLPGDEPPIGIKVREAGGRSEMIGEVRGALGENGTHDKNGKPVLAYWWIVRVKWDKEYDVYWWPPMLERVEATS